MLNRIAAKSAINYPSDTILIIDCTLSLPYMPDEWDELMACVRSELPKTQFREIYLYDAVGQHSLSIYPPHET
jgi:hypothetical protein